LALILPTSGGRSVGKVRLRNKATEFSFLCLTEAWLKKSFSSQNIFPEIYTAYGSDRDCHTKLGGGGASIAVSETVFGAKIKSDAEYFQECVWVEITLTDSRIFLICNHSFYPDIKV
jgi:hypothetical protein